MSNSLFLHNNLFVCIGYHPSGWYPCLIAGDTVAEDLIIPHRVAPLAAAIGGVALDGVNSAVFHLFHDTHMIRLAIQTAAVTFSFPVEEDNHARTRLNIVPHPLSPVFEPLNTIKATGELGDDIGSDISTSIGAPADKTGTPFHTLGKSIPAPVRFSTYIANLGSRNFYDQCRSIRVI